jgi:type II secretory pathway pseudopilin PulG
MKRPMARLRSDSGFALLEVVVSAAVLAIMALAVLSGIDGAAASSAREKARAVAVSLAEADQERLRSMSVTDLATAAATSTFVVPDPAGTTRTVDGVTYTIVSKAQWVRDADGASVSCTSTSAADYFHISSTVTSRIVGSNIPAVTMDSISAPNVAYSSTRGTLAVQVLDAKGNPVPNALVNVTGGTSPPPSKTTNSLGCAVFEQVPTNTAGVDYTAKLGTAGWIDPSANPTPSQTQKVFPGQLTMMNFTYDRAATVTTNVVTYAPGSTAAVPGVTIPSKASQVTTVNSKATGKLFPSTQSGTDLAGFTTSNLFPFQNNYVFFTGSCHYNDPTDQTNYSTANTASPNGARIASQQLFAPASGVNVFQPPINYQIKTNSQGVAPTAAMTVVLTPVPPGSDTCAQPKVSLTTVQLGSGASAKWVVARSATAQGVDAGAPFGRYTMCFQDGTGASAKKWSAGNYDNTTPPTGQPTALTGSPAKANWTSGTC